MTELEVIATKAGIDPAAFPGELLAAEVVRRAGKNTTEPVAPNTTAQQDLTAKRQSDINRIWELTQSGVAMVTVAVAAVVTVIQIQIGKGNEFPSVMNSWLMLVLGFYFGRTNHTRTGGTGPRLSGLER